MQQRVAQYGNFTGFHNRTFSFHLKSENKVNSSDTENTQCQEGHHRVGQTGGDLRGHLL